MDVCPAFYSLARVACASRGSYLLWTSTNEDLLATVSGAIEVIPVAGDWVRYDPATARIHEVVPRTNKLARKKAGSATQEQVIAANVDVLFLVMALDQDFNLRRLERYLILAAESAASPVIVLNKSDQCSDLLARLQEIGGIVQGAPVVVMSAIDGASTAQLSRYIETGQTAALLGSSGVGKSTITNALLGASRQHVSSVREHDSRGRHTTTNRELFRMPGGWFLLDTPGMRELEPWSIVESVAAVFQDIEALRTQCRFSDCRHKGEPGCAVQGAILAGTIDAQRVDSFHKLTKEVDLQTRKRLGKQSQRAWRKMQKNIPKHQR